MGLTLWGCLMPSAGGGISLESGSALLLSFPMLTGDSRAAEEATVVSRESGDPDA